MPQAKWWKISLIVIGAAVGLIVCVWLLATYWPGGVDYYSQYYPISNQWVRGKIQIYDEQSGGYYQAPWVIPLLLPFTLWPYDIGRALLWIASMAIIVVGVLIFSKPGRHRPWVLAFAIFNLFTFDLQYRSQIDALAALGFILGWIAISKHKPWLLAVAYVSLTIKVPNTIPVALFFLWFSVKRWPHRDIVTSLMLPVSMVLSSFLIFPGWVPRWRESMLGNPPLIMWQTTIWRISDFLGLPRIVPWLFAILAISVSIWAWVRAGDIGHDQSSPDLSRVTLSRFMIVIACTFVVTPYSLSYHFVPLLAIVMPLLAGWRMSVVVGLYLLTYMPIARVFLGENYSWIDMTFALATFVATIAYIVDMSRKTIKEQELTHEFRRYDPA